MARLHTKYPKLFNLIILLAIFSFTYSKLDLIKAYATSNAVLSFAEKTVTISPGEKHSIPVKLNTMGQKAIGVDVVITYNPNVIKVLGSASLDEFDNPVISEIDNENGIASFHLINDTDNYSIVNNKDIFVVSIIGTSTGNSTLKIKSKQAESKDTKDLKRSHVTLIDKTDALGHTGKLLVKVKLDPTTNHKSYGITKDDRTISGIEPIANSKVLGASDTRKNSNLSAVLDIATRPITVVISVISLFLWIIGIKIYKAYKRSLDEVIHESEKE